jgi:hypothetical protein
LYDLYTIEEFAHLVIIIILLDTLSMSVAEQENNSNIPDKVKKKKKKKKKVHSRNFEKELISILRQWKRPEVC